MLYAGAGTSLIYFYLGLFLTFMRCKFCNQIFKMSKYSPLANACNACSGVYDDLEIPDDELQIELKVLKSPTGKTKSTFSDDDLEEIRWGDSKNYSDSEDYGHGL
jgi:hypothetical protein